MLTIKNSKNYDETRAAKQKLLVFVDLDRPFKQGEIIKDLIWRREHSKPFANNEILEAIAPYLNEHGLTVERISYSRKAGCSMCPCSPGYVVYCNEPSNGYSVGIWLDYEPDMSGAVRNA